ncbi:LOW QUALITY PROTEIN: Golgi integral membrane protein 4-like [Tachyglossus aculeatus]|uniref:LOW QUALITY PROTEIN: Golgi integral membrane protein 4-like n=1 Tax=Tachyglossus aculeatus TaxID=9261 RepID=UPI0018F5CC6E|nr:LOW QUALITY PROTEIN: Golgi integral membrane protein 4-like [Tachyglossus aculeatus]
MGSGGWPRRQKGLLQSGFLLSAALGLVGAGLLYDHLQRRARAAEGQASLARGQQEAMAAQLQVVYEHRSRLERSLQKERGDHKKTKEDFLVYKLEAQEALNKEKQDAMNRYGALSSQHKILKNQHEDVKKQLRELQGQHNGLKLEQRRTLESHGQQLAQLQRDRDSEVAGLQDLVSKLRAESRLLRQAHQEVHTQLLGAQAQVEEFRQLKEALQKMPSFKDLGPGPQEPTSRVGGSRAHLEHPKVIISTARIPREAQAPVAPARVPTRLQEPGQGRVSHLARVANPQPTSLLSDQRVQGGAEAWLRETGAPPSLPPAPGREPPVHPASRTPPVQMQSWQDIVNKVNAQMGEEQGGQNGNVPAANQDKEVVHPAVNQGGDPNDGTDEEELEMDAGMIEREEDVRPQKDPATQELLRAAGQPPASPSWVPAEDPGPAQDPNNQGEDEFEEAELERPEFEGRTGKTGPRPEKARDLLDNHRDNREPEDRGGEEDESDDPQLVPQGGTRVALSRTRFRFRKESYY